MHPELTALRERPIPRLADALKAKHGYREWPITKGPLYDEPLVDVREYGIAGVNNLANYPHNPPYRSPVEGSIEGLFVRTSVGSRLQTINRFLARGGLELFVYDAWRPLSIQNYMHDVWFPEVLRKKYPHWDEERIMREVENYWAKGATGDPDPNSPPPHGTGAALDLTIRVIGGSELWMGTIVDDVSSRAHTDALERKHYDLSFSEDEAIGNRRLLYWLMRSMGFMNNPTEWWHYSVGDQMWAKLRTEETGGAHHAYYGLALIER